jgi:hypothetical protein
LFQNIPHSHSLLSRTRQIVQNTIVPILSSTIVMENQFSPLILPAQLHLLLDNYALRIRQLGAEGDITSQQHLDKFLNFIELEEVDYEDVKMIIFTQFFSRDVRKWFRGLLGLRAKNIFDF